MADNIKRIIIHCAATPNGKRLGNARQTAAQRIDDMHARRGFARRPWHINTFNPHLKAIGYHYIIDTDGTLESGRAEGEQGRAAAGWEGEGHGVDSIRAGQARASGCDVGGFTAPSRLRFRSARRAAGRARLLRRVPGRAR